MNSDWQLDIIEQACKVMSDTPRADDALAIDQRNYTGNNIVNIARQLERELASANARIKRLEEAGDRMAMWVLPEYEADPANTALKVWNKAKEAKP